MLPGLKIGTISVLYMRLVMRLSSMKDGSVVKILTNRQNMHIRITKNYFGNIAVGP